MRTGFLALLLCVSVAPSAEAQRMIAPGLATGARVRVTTAEAAAPRVVGTFLSGQHDTLRVGTSGGTMIVSFPYSAVERLEVSSGRARGKWAWGGALAGLVGGVIIGGIMGGQDDNTGHGAEYGRLGGIFFGPPIGALAGALVAPERWREHPVSLLR